MLGILVTIIFEAGIVLFNPARLLIKYEMFVPVYLRVLRLALKQSCTMYGGVVSSHVRWFLSAVQGSYLNYSLMAIVLWSFL